MKTTRFLLVNILISTLAASIVLTVSKFDLTVYAQRDAGSQSKRWEYCFVSPNIAMSKNGTGGNAWEGYVNVTFLDDSGTRTEQMKGVANVNLGAATNNAFAHAIGALGSEGWEMVGPGRTPIDSGADQTVLYFKRQRN